MTITTTESVSILLQTASLQTQANRYAYLRQVSNKALIKKIVTKK